MVILSTACFAMRKIPPGLEEWLTAEEAATEVEQDAESDASSSARPWRKRGAQNRFYDGDEDGGDDGGGEEAATARPAPARHPRQMGRRSSERSWPATMTPKDKGKPLLLPPPSEMDVCTPPWLHQSLWHLSWPLPLAVRKLVPVT
jgi:hypothetical protein